jgi:hypothetical protein
MSAAKRRPAKRTTKVAAKRAKGSGAAKRARRRTTKVAAKRAGARKRGPKRVAKRTPRRKSARTSARKSALRVVRRPVARPTKAATAFPQRAGASSKQSVLFELMRARAALAAAVQGLSGGSAGEPVAPGKWSVREVVLHLTHWDRETLRALESALTGRSPEWMAWGEVEDAHANRAAVASLAHYDWDGALRLLHANRAELLTAIESVPEEPADVWAREHAFGQLLYSSTQHDRHHADIIKRWRTRGPQ